MQIWEFVLQEKFEQDRMRLMDYREIDLEFKEWLIKLLYEEVKEKDERSEHGTYDDPLHDDRVCDRECVRTEQNQDADSGPDYEDGFQFEAGAAEERLRNLIAAEPTEAYEAEEPVAEDIYESYYDEIVEYKSNLKARPKKKKHKRK